MRKFILLSVCLIAMGTGAENLYFFGESGDSPVQTHMYVRRITFSENAMNLEKSSGDISVVDFASFKCFAFTEEVSAVESEKERMTHVTVEGSGMLVITANAPIESVDVFNLSGMKLFGYSPAVAEFSHSLRAYPVGVYVVRVVVGGNLEVYKIVK